MQRADMLIKTPITAAYVASQREPFTLVNVTPPTQPEVYQLNVQPYSSAKNIGVEMRIYYHHPWLFPI